METTHATIGLGLGGKARTRTVLASAAVAAALASSFAVGRITAPAESAAIRPAPVVVTLPAQSPLRSHQPHHRVKFGS